MRRAAHVGASQPSAVPQGSSRPKEGISKYTIITGIAIAAMTLIARPYIKRSENPFLTGAALFVLLFTVAYCVGKIMAVWDRISHSTAASQPKQPEQEDITRKLFEKISSSSVIPKQSLKVSNCTKTSFLTADHSDSGFWSDTDDQGRLYFAVKIFFKCQISQGYVVEVFYKDTDQKWKIRSEHLVTNYYSQIFIPNQMATPADGYSIPDPESDPKPNNEKMHFFGRNGSEVHEDVEEKVQALFKGEVLTDKRINFSLFQKQVYTQVN
jgi:hypothetical protein